MQILEKEERKKIELNTADPIGVCCFFITKKASNEALFCICGLGRFSREFFLRRRSEKVWVPIRLFLKLQKHISAVRISHGSRADDILSSA